MPHEKPQISEKPIEVEAVCVPAKSVIGCDDQCAIFGHLVHDVSNKPINPPVDLNGGGGKTREVMDVVALRKHIEVQVPVFEVIEMRGV